MGVHVVLSGERSHCHVTPVTPPSGSDRVAVSEVLARAMVDRAPVDRVPIDRVRPEEKPTTPSSSTLVTLMVTTASE